MEIIKMRWVKAISRKSYLLPIYTIWNGLQENIDEFLAESKESFITYYPDFDCRKNTSKALTEKIVADPNFIKDYMAKSMSLSDKTRGKAKELRFIETHKLTNKELWGNIKSVLDLLFESGKTITQAREHAYSYVVEKLKEKINKEEIDNLLMTLTNPTTKSLAMVEEDSLLKKAKKILDQSSSELFQNLVNQHHDEWAWIPTDWAIGTPWTKTDIKNRLISFIKSNPQEKLMEIEREYEEKKKHRETSISKYNLSRDITDLIGMMEIEAFYRLHRRYVLSELLYYSQPLFEELSFRIGLETDFVYNLVPREIEDFLLQGKGVKKEVISNRLKYFILSGKNRKINVICGDEARKLAEKELNFQIKEDTNFLKGQIGCKGHVIGIARLVQTTKDFDKVIEGDILVTHETTPDFIPLLRKVKAIVTDEGGISCHAAVISREMNIPCVIGTFVGTKVIKDGEKIEVNALEGYVKRLE